MSILGSVSVHPAAPGPFRDITDGTATALLLCFPAHAAAPGPSLSSSHTTLFRYVARRFPDSSRSPTDPVSLPFLSQVGTFWKKWAFAPISRSGYWQSYLPSTSAKRRSSKPFPRCRQVAQLHSCDYSYRLPSSCIAGDSVDTFPSQTLLTSLSRPFITILS